MTHLSFSTFVPKLLILTGLLFYFNIADGQKNLPVYKNQDNSLEYTADSLGNRVPDYSYCGYNSGNTSIPDIPVKVFVSWKKGDATESIQKAITYASQLPLDENGFRGTILLDKGTFLVNGRLRIKSSGIVLRGSGAGANRTKILVGGKDRETLFGILGTDNITVENELAVQDNYLPVNSFSLNLKSGHKLSIGDRINIRRPVTNEWVDVLGMKSFGGGRETETLGWHPGRNQIIWDRTITKIDGNTIYFDAPVTTALDAKYGGGFVSKYTWKERLKNIGIENLQLESTFDQSNPKDEEHCWMAITIENAENCWVRQVSFKHFAGSAVAVYETAQKVTVEDCISTEPVSEIGGQRRYTFFTSGQQTLFQRCYAESGYHDFAVGNFAAGPNAFVQCESHMPYSLSGTIDRWASGVLFDIILVDGNTLSLKNREIDGQGAGWTAANSMLWQCAAAKIECYSPPTATNWAYGTWGQFAGNGFWHEPNSHVSPRSLYYAQLKDRIGPEAEERAFLFPVDPESTSTPSVALALELTKKSAQSPVQLKDWIETAQERNPIPVSKTGAYNINQLKSAQTKILELKNPVQIKNGWLVNNDGVATGRKQNTQWWRGNTRPFALSRSGPHITRFVPGRTGTGLTDDLEEVSDYMFKNNFIAIYHNYGLWYDRRRDDHERIRRMDGEVWPPFYELPFARSGQGLAFDGLSKYDLTKPNTWYWSRLGQFADLADKGGFVLIHQNYFQHNVLEAGAHYTDFPWRTANNINNTGFPEPPPYAGDKRIFIAEQFYDLKNEHRKELHTHYIYQCLNNFENNTNIIQMISEEYTGPLHFVEFWFGVIIDWEKEKRKNALIALSTTKDVQDAILKDPIRGKAVDIIDIKYWQIRKDGSVYAPEGGKNLAPRQHARLIKPGGPSFETVYKAVSQYKTMYPDKAVIYSNRLDAKHHWAVFMAGGSLAAIPKIEDKGFLKSASGMHPVLTKKMGIYKLKNDELEQIIYASGNDVEIDLKKVSGKFTVFWINPSDGKTTNRSPLEGGKKHKLTAPKEGGIILWIRKE